LLPLHGAAGAEVRVGRDFGFVLNSSGSVQAWGRNRYGQLGIDSDALEAADLQEVLIPDGEPVVDLAAGAFHSLFVTESGIAYAAGRNNHGQLGLGDLDATSVPIEVLRDVRSVATGYAHSLFLMKDGSVKGAGLNQHGQLGNVGAPSLRTPVLLDVPGPDLVTAIAAGYDFSFFLTQAGDVYGVGQNLGGQLGDGTRRSASSPVKVKLENVEAVTAGETHALFLGTNGTVWVTGVNLQGQLGLDVREVEVMSEPVQVVPAAATAVFAGGEGSAFLSGETGPLSVMGSNAFGQLGLGKRTFANSVPEVLQVKSLQTTLPSPSTTGSLDPDAATTSGSTTTPDELDGNETSTSGMPNAFGGMVLSLWEAVLLIAIPTVFAGILGARPRTKSCIRSALCCQNRRRCCRSWRRCRLGFSSNGSAADLGSIDMPVTVTDSQPGSRERRIQEHLEKSQKGIEMT